MTIRSALATTATAGALLLAGCGGEELSADSTCEEYLNQPASIRHDVAIRVSTQIEGVSNPGNPMWGLNTDAVCGSNLDMTLREIFSRGT
jgi:hypothetical protein